MTLTCIVLQPSPVLPKPNEGNHLTDLVKPLLLATPFLASDMLKEECAVIVLSTVLRRAQ